MNSGTLESLQTRLGQTKCPAGHNRPIRYVNSGPEAKQRFLCINCNPQENSTRSRETIDLEEYVDDLKALAISRTKPEPKVLNESTMALQVTQQFKHDISESLGAIKQTIDKHYSDVIERLTRAAQKCKNRIHSKLDHDVRKSLAELNSIEASLNIFKEGGNPQTVEDILDQAMNYIDKKPQADNSLYDLLSGLNPKESVQSTHLRLYEFGNKYFSRKTLTISGLKEALELRFKKDEDLCNSFISERKKILESLDGYLAGSQAQQQVVDDKKSPSPMGRKTFRGILRTAKSHFDVHDYPLGQKDPSLGKRKSDVEIYDPMLSFERTFGLDCTNSIDKKYSKLSMTGGETKVNRLSALITSKPQASQAPSQSENILEKTPVREDLRKTFRSPRNGNGQKNRPSKRNRSKRKGRPVPVGNVGRDYSFRNFLGSLYEEPLNQPINSLRAELEQPYAIRTHLGERNRPQGIVLGPLTHKEPILGTIVTEVPRISHSLERDPLDKPIKRMLANDPRRQYREQLERREQFNYFAQATAPKPSTEVSAGPTVGPHNNL